MKKTITLAMLLICTNAHAMILFDSGPSQGKEGFFPNVAGQFYLDREYLVSGFESPFFLNKGGGKEVGVALYNNDGGLPGSEIFRQIMSLPIIEEELFYPTVKWAGMDLGLTLNEGYYWLAYEKSDNGFVMFPGMTQMASAYELGGSYHSVPHGLFALKVYGDVPVSHNPEPSTLALLGMGMIGLMRRKH